MNNSIPFNPEPCPEFGELSGFAPSFPVLDFPPCFSQEQIIVSEIMMFALFPKLTSFIRDITEFERVTGAASAAPGANAVLVTRDQEDGPQRTYGTEILLGRKSNK